MNPITLAPVNIVHIVIISVALLAFFLVMSRPQCKALMVLLVILVIENSFNLIEELSVNRHIHLVTPAVMLAYGPAYYLFARNLVYGHLSLRKHGLHFLPAVLCLPFTAWWTQLLQLGFVLLVIYIVATIRLLSHYHRILAEVTADNESHALRWLSITLGVIFVLSVIDFTRLNLQLILGVEILRNWYFVSTVITLSYSCYLIIMAVRQPVLYSGIADFEKSTLANDTSTTAGTTEYEPQGQTGHQDQTDPQGQTVLQFDEYSAVIFTAIDNHMHTNKAYRQAKYSLLDLAKDLGLDQRDVSLAINKVGGESFSDYINAFRVEEVKQRILLNGGKCNLLEVGYNAGFNSKSSFNSVFKKLSGSTPSQYASNQPRSSQ